MGALVDYLRSQGITLTQAAAVARVGGVDRRLLLRVDANEQPLPYEACVNLAGALGLDLGDVVRACGSVIRRNEEQDWNPRPGRVPDQPARPLSPNPPASQVQTAVNSSIGQNAPNR